MRPLIFEPHRQPQWYQALGVEWARRGGSVSAIDESPNAWREALDSLPSDVVPQLLIGGPLAAGELRAFERLSSADLDDFMKRTLLGQWLALQKLSQLEFRDGASIVMLQSVRALEATPDTALLRASLYAVRAMFKAAALEASQRTPAVRFNLLLIPPQPSATKPVVDALEQVAASSFMTGSEVAVRAAPASPHG